MTGSIKSFDLNNIGSIQCVALAKDEKAKNELLKRAYWVMFSPEQDGINCWILCRDKSENQDLSIQGESTNNPLEIR